MGVYLLLLRLYPASFRHEYGDELRDVFARRLQTATSRFDAARLWMVEIGGLLTSAVLVHVDILKQDLAYIARGLRRTPGFAVTAVLIVMLGIGATTAAFSVTDFVLIRPLPFPEAQRLVKLWETTPGYSRLELSAANFRDWSSAATSFESIASYHSQAVNMTGRSEPLRLAGTSVSANLFPTLGVTAIAGRSFAADDDRAGAPGTMVLSHRLWQTEFGGDPQIVGQTLLLDSSPFTVIGIMPREFRFPTSDVLFWTTNRFSEANFQDRNDNWLNAVGRLRRGVTLAEANAEIRVIADQSKQQYPTENKDTGARLVALADEVSQQSRLLLMVLSGTAGCVLLIACANLANLLLARALGRRRELAVRAAMGAGRERLIRQLLTESLLLAAVGGALGVALAVASVPLLARLVPTTLPIADTPAVDIRVLVFAIGLTAITGIAFGLVPVMRVGGPDLDGLRDGPRGGTGGRAQLRAALVVAEIVASVVLLVSAGLLVRALLTIQGTDPGFKADGVLSLRTPLPLPKYERVATREAFYERVLTDVRGLPGVSAAGYVSFLPLSAFRGGIWPVSINGQEAVRTEHQVAALRYATPGYLQALSIPLKSGRDIESSDRQDRPFVAVVSESFTRHYWPDQDPLGRHFAFALSDRVVVGVVGNVMFRGLERESEPQVYVPSAQVEDGSIAFYAPKELAVKADVPVATLAPSVRAIIRKADAQLPVSDVRPLTDLVDLETASRAVQVRVLGAFAAIAFVLAAVGIHGLLSFTVSQRAQEMGLRRALGAQSGDILRLMARQWALLAIGGLVPGIVLAYAAGRAMQTLLAGVAPTDPVTLFAAVGLIVLMTALGSLFATIRALRVNPMTALRTE